MEPRVRQFFRNSEKALADRTLQVALSRTTKTFLERRSAAVAEYPRFEGARERASRIRQEALDNLDSHLARFIT